jgi:chaperonin cofactor prefoldin
MTGGPMLTRVEEDKDVIDNLKKYILDIETTISNLKEKAKHLKKHLKSLENEDELYAVYGGD